MLLSKEHLLWGLLVLNYALCSLLRDSAMVVLPPLMGALSLSAASVGFISAVYHYSYGSVQSLLGAACDRFGAIRLCGTSLLICVCGVVFFAIGTSPLMLAFGRLLMGLGMGPAFAAVLVFQAQAFSEEDYPIYAALSTILSNLGNVAAISPLGAALDAFGKQTVFLAIAIFTFILALAMLVSSSLYEGHRRRSNVPLKVSELLWGGFSCVCRNRRLLFTTLFWCVSMGLQLAFLGLWGVPWYQTVWGLSAAHARRWMTISAFSVMCGAFTGGALGRRFNGNGFVVLASYIMMLAGWSVLIGATALKTPLICGAAAGVLIGFSSGNCNVLCSSYIRAISPSRRLGAVLGSVSMAIFVSGIIFQWGAGIIMSCVLKGGKTAMDARGFLYSFGSFVMLSYLFIPQFIRAQEFRKIG